MVVRFVNSGEIDDHNCFNILFIIPLQEHIYFPPISLVLPMELLPIIINVVSSNRVHGEVYSIQHYVIKFIYDLRQVGGFLRVFQFPPPIKRTAMI